MKGLSVVLPAYNEEEMIPIITEALTGRLEQEKILYELIFVSDGSTDDTWEAIEKETGKNDRVRGVEFSRNFGKDSAIFAGMAQAVMDAVAVMDCDLQHPVDTLISMYRIWENGSEIVEGIKSQRGRENLLYRKGVGWFYRILSKTLKMDMENASDFKLMDRKVVDSLLQMPERHLFFRAVSAWAGYRTTQVKYQVGERPKGKSKWNLEISDFLWFSKYCGLYYVTPSVCDHRRGDMLSGIGAAGNLFFGKIFPRTGSGGVYNPFDGTSGDWKWNHDQSRDYRILYW